MRMRGSVVNAAAQMLSSGDVNLDTLPDLILRIIKDGMWRQRAIPQLRWELSKEFDSFEEFVIAEPLDGLRTTIPTLKDLCRRNTAAVDAIDGELRKSAKPGTRTDLVDNVNKVGRPDGNSQAQALRRLREDRPDLHARVLLPKGDPDWLSPHAAAVRAGHRRPTFTIRADSAESAERAIRSHMDPEQIELLVERLTKEN